MCLLAMDVWGWSDQTLDVDHVHEFSANLAELGRLVDRVSRLDHFANSC